MIGLAAGLARREKSLLRHLHRLCHPPRLRPDQHQRGLCEQQREDRRHGAGHHPGPERRHAHVLSTTWPSCAPCPTCTSTARRMRTSCGRSCATWPPDRQPTYMQLVRVEDAEAFRGRLRLRPAHGQVPARGGDVTVVATGYMTRYALDVARTLEAKGIAVDLLHYPSVKPFDAETLVASAKRTGRVVTVENQNISAGSAVRCARC